MEELDKLKAEIRLRGLSPMTVRGYTFFVDKFLKSVNKPIAELNQDDAKMYISALYDTKSKNTIMLAVASLKFFYSQILKKDFSDVRVPKRDAKLPSVL